jgi:hypothetical protein
VSAFKVSEYDVKKSNIILFVHVTFLNKDFGDAVVTGISSFKNNDQE